MPDREQPGPLGAPCYPHSYSLVFPQSPSGIGLESALLFAQEGADVLLVDVNLPAAEKALALIQQRFPNVKAAALKADVGKEADVKAAVDKAVELFGRLDVMVRPLPSLFPASSASRRATRSHPRTEISTPDRHADPLHATCSSTTLVSIPPTIRTLARPAGGLRAREPHPAAADPPPSPPLPSLPCASAFSSASRPH